MALPTIVAVGTAANVTTGTLSPGIPAGTAANDILILFVESANQPLNTVTGYNRIGSGSVVQATGLISDLSAFWKRAGASEVAPAVTSTPQDHLSGRIVGVRGAAANSSPLHVVNPGVDNVSSTSATIPGGTTTVADCLIFAAISTGVDVNSTAMASGWASTTTFSPALAEQVDNWTLSGNGGGIAVACGGRAAIGAYNAITVTLATAATKAMMSFAITATETVPGIIESPIGVDRGRDMRGGAFGY